MCEKEGCKGLDKLYQEVMETIQTLAKETPQQMKAFHELLESVMKDGALTTKTKELIALAIAISTQCQYCIAFHLKKALEAGASKEEILEAVWVAVLMHGGPACTYTYLVLKGLGEVDK